MKYILFFLSFILFFGITAFAQDKILLNAHSHNDYKQKKPLETALNYKVKSIEADVFLIKGKLIVAHTYPLLKKRKTLQNLYLQPLFDSISKNGSVYEKSKQTIILLIDIKSNAENVYTVLCKEFEKYKPFLTSVENGKVIERQLTIVLSGKKPYAKIVADTNRFMFIDQSLLSIDNSNYDSSVCYMASAKYSNLIKKRQVSAIEEENLKKIIIKAHQQGKLVRLWAIPEDEAVWKTLLDYKLDLIGADDLEKLKLFLEKK